jgi:hypothetical protein
VQQQELHGLRAELKMVTYERDKLRQEAAPREAGQRKTLAAAETRVAQLVQENARLLAALQLAEESQRMLQHANDALANDLETALKGRSVALKARARRSMAFHHEQTRRVHAEEEIKVQRLDLVREATDAERDRQRAAATLAQERKKGVQAGIQAAVAESKCSKVPPGTIGKRGVEEEY